MATKLSTLLAILPVIFTALSLAFIVTSFISSDWARQSFFSPSLQPLDWNDALYTLRRSPFVVCTASASKPDSNTTQYDVTCTRFKIYGHGATACVTPNEAETYSAVTGDWRMCQQVHFSGNFALAALVFACLGFLLVAILTAVFVAKSSRHTSYDGRKRSSSNRASHSYSESSPRRGSVHYGTGLQLATYTTLAAVGVTALCAFLSQFYGILGLIQSQPDNGMWASLSLGAVQDQQTGDLSNAPWVQGRVLTVYLSLGWFFGGLTCAAIGTGWMGRFRN